MSRTEQVTVEIVHVRSLVSAPVTAPGVRVGVSSFVNKVERLVGEGDAAVGARVHGRRRPGLAALAGLTRGLGGRGLPQPRPLARPGAGERGLRPRGWGGRPLIGCGAAVLACDGSKQRGGRAFEDRRGWRGPAEAEILDLAEVVLRCLGLC